MSELDRLRSLADRVVPPSFEVLRETARRLGVDADPVAGHHRRREDGAGGWH